ncbi:GTP pyrophosphokinase family protein [Cellulosimicrobium funkei]|nr:GTP pyrophosphokinase family protein [Cellulosimicrobium funkei]
MNQLRKLGKRIRDDEYLPEQSPNYEEVMEWYDDIAAFVVGFLWQCDWSPLLDSRNPQIVSRVKTIDTLREKLRRESSFPLPQIQDIAGIRFEAEMTLEEQDAVVAAITGHFEDMGWRPRTTDYRTTGGHSGYRAVHVLLHLEPLGRVEVQVRTHLQGKWANMYEYLADKVGREIRYDVLPDDPMLQQLVKRTQQASLVLVSELETLRMRAERLRRVEESPEQIEEIDSVLGEMRETEASLLNYFQTTEENLRQIDWEAIH